MATQANLTADPRQILQERDAEIASIRGRVEWTEEAKNERIAAVHEWAQREYAEAREAERERIQQRLESAKQAVFQVPGGIWPPMLSRLRSWPRSVRPGRTCSLPPR
jgi:hypothetical protein